MRKEKGAETDGPLGADLGPVERPRLRELFETTGWPGQSGAAP